jgi:integrase
MFFGGSSSYILSVKRCRLNRRKVSRYFGEYKKVVKDRAYTAEEIYKALQTSDLRMKVIILLMCSGGQRIGSLADLTLGNLVYIEPYGIFKVTVYDGTNSEYYTFTTRETANAIFEYLSYRQRSGERINFNDQSKEKKWEPENVPLLREQFDATDILHVRRPRTIGTNAIRRVLVDQLVRCGLRTVEHPIGGQSMKRVRKSVALGNGFRKFAISAFSRAKINHDILLLINDLFPVILHCVIPITSLSLTSRSDRFLHFGQFPTIFIVFPSYDSP